MKKKLCLSSSNKWIAGVCGGIAECYDFNPLIVRIAFIVVGIILGFFGWALIVLYAALWFILSKSDSIDVPIETVAQRDTKKQPAALSPKPAKKRASPNRKKPASVVSSKPVDERISDEIPSPEMNTDVSMFFDDNDFSNFSSVDIPEGVTDIPDEAFEGCSNLTSITIPSSVTSIGESAFKGCSGLTIVTIPDSVTSIGDSAFKDCSCLTSVTTGNSLTSIGNEAFSGCSNLTSITIPNSVTSIGDSAFAGCRGLTSVTIPNSVTSIGEEAFYNCGELSVVFDGGEFKRGYGIFSDTSILSVLYNGEVIPLCVRAKEIIIGDSITCIPNEAFKGYSGLTSVTIGNSVTSIGDSAFDGCSGLKDIVIPDSVETIGTNAFANCKIDSFTIGKSVKNYAKFVDLYGFFCIFKNSSIKELIVKAEAAEYVGPRTSISKVVLCDSVKEIKKWFLAEVEPFDEIIIPDSVTKIDDWAFTNTNLKKIVFPKNLEELGKIGDLPYLRRLDFSKVTKLKTIPLEFLGKTPKLRELAFPMGVVELKDHCGGTVLSTVFLPPTVEKVGEVGYDMSIYCFSPKLDSLEAIGDGAEDSSSNTPNYLYVLPGYLDAYKRQQKEEGVSEKLLEIRVMPDEHIHYYDK